MIIKMFSPADAKKFARERMEQWQAEQAKKKLEAKKRGITEEAAEAKPEPDRNENKKADTSNLSETEQRKLNTELIEAAKAGKKEKVEELLLQGAQIDGEEKYDWTALMGAAYYGRKETAELLIANGANVNERSNHGYTALMGAACNGHKEIVEFLIAKGANVNERSNVGWTALKYAKIHGRTEIVDLLIQHGATE